MYQCFRQGFHQKSGWKETREARTADLDGDGKSVKPNHLGSTNVDVNG